MRRIVLNLSIALLTFSIGLVIYRAFDGHLCPFNTGVYECRTTELIELAVTLPPGEQVTEPGSLPIELARIDQVYSKQCEVPTEWRGGWPTIRQLSKFKNCNDRWAHARRTAIIEEMNHYRVMY